jgi:hydrogenase-4 component F
VGVAFAFMGTLLFAAAAGGKTSLLWTEMNGKPGLFNPLLIKAAFIFLLVGYGTKAGLAPMHNWLPDAHSQAPAPVSALFSGFMLSAALYCVMRYLPIVEPATGNSGWSLKMMMGFGLLSILIAAAFMPFQKNVKRFLAYSSMEHLGIIALGLGLGGFGVFAALFHTLNHALGKTLSFFSAGRLGQLSDSHDMQKMSGAMKISPLWGKGLLGGVLALIGMAPFSPFMSEFQIVKAAVDKGSVLVLILFFLGVGTVFVAALGHLLPLVWGKPQGEQVVQSANRLETALVWIPLILLLCLGIWMPDFLRRMLTEAAAVLQPSVKSMATGMKP